MDMGTHIETIILIFRSARVTLAHFKVSQETIKFILMRLDEILSNSCTLLGIYEQLDNNLKFDNMENLDKAFMPGYITTSLNGKVIEVTKAEVTEAEQKMVGNYHKTVLRTCKK